MAKKGACHKPQKAGGQIGKPVRSSYVAERITHKNVKITHALLFLIK